MALLGFGLGHCGLQLLAVRLRQLDHGVLRVSQWFIFIASLSLFFISKHMLIVNLLFLKCVYSYFLNFYYYN